VQLVPPFETEQVTSALSVHVNPLTVAASPLLNSNEAFFKSFAWHLAKVAARCSTALFEFEH
jgi:hypothetical protein